MTSLMLQGTASGVGKSILVAGLCRLLAREGVRVAPFKPQNMSNNAAVTVDGGEIGRAQALQALACGLPPCADMNPVLLKPEGDRRAQLVVRGRAAGTLHAERFREDRRRLLPVVLDAFERLRARYDVVLVEGAGSPAEPNLLDGDIANMGFASAADVPVWLVGDIDRGGVFAALVGTLAILPPAARARVRALVVNRFRGHRGLLEDALAWLERTSGLPVAGTVPYLERLDLPEEDIPYTLQARAPAAGATPRPRVAAIHYPTASNLTDLDPLALDAELEVRLAREPDEIAGADLVVLPGSKHVAADLAWLRERGFAPVLERHLRYGGRVLGICGGMQMLGREIDDPDGVEGGGRCAGLGWLRISTRMGVEKALRRVEREARWPEPLPVRGYEIHHGETPGDDARFPFNAVSADEQVFGTYLHGLLDADAFRAACLHRWLSHDAAPLDTDARRVRALDALADALADALDPRLLEPLRRPRRR